MSLTTAAAPAAAAPPPGPGVRPPFVAPPTDGIRTRRWVGIGTGIGALVLVCAGIGVGINVLVAAGEAAYRDQAVQAVHEYLGDINQGHYDDAYALLCAADQATVSPQAFAARYTARPVVEFRVHPAELVNGEAIVPADLRYASGDVDTINYPVILAADGARVCP